MILDKTIKEALSYLIIMQNYETAVLKLLEALPFVNSVAIIEGETDLVFSTDNWNIKTEIAEIVSSWISMKSKSIIVSGVKYVMRQFTIDRLVATSLSGEGHIVGVQNEERKIIAQIEPDGIIPFTTVEMTKVLDSLSYNKPYIDESIQFGQNSQKLRSRALIKEKPASFKKFEDETTEVTFTARLMAHYRAQESKRDKPLIIDPFAERLAGDLKEYLSKHIRYSEMDYPIVRSYYIEKKLLGPWCNTYEKSQIVLLGAGLDTRAYRFKPLKSKSHTVFEVDLPLMISYKEEILKNEQPLCELIRLPIDLSKLGWSSQLIDNGFSKDIPTFWVIEGLVYYIEQDSTSVLLSEAADISTEHSQIFVDLMQRSRWFESSEPLFVDTTDSFSRHFKWGIDIKEVPYFLAANGWNVSCCFADDHDQNRDVGQKAMIFIHGKKSRDIN